MATVTSRPEPKVRRKQPAQRRAEIAATATRLALERGLQHVTLRSVADSLGVYPGLVSHYFASVDTLLAEAFGSAVSAELEEVFAEVSRQRHPLAAMRRLLELIADDDREQVSLLWLDGWHSGGRRPALRREVTAQMSAWVDRVSALIAGGVDAGVFRVPDARASAIRIIAVLDGLSIQTIMRDEVGFATVRDLVFDVVERELGLRSGALTR